MGGGARKRRRDKLWKEYDWQHAAAPEMTVKKEEAPEEKGSPGGALEPHSPEEPPPGWTLPEETAARPSSQQKAMKRQAPSPSLQTRLWTRATSSSSPPVTRVSIEAKKPAEQNLKLQRAVEELRAQKAERGGATPLGHR